MPDENLNYNISGKADNSAAKSAEKALQDVGAAGRKIGEDVGYGAREAQKFLKKFQEGALGLTGAFKAGIGIGLAETAISAIEEIGVKFKEAFEEGIHYNAEMETSINGLAGALRSVEPEKYLTFASALKDSGPLFD